MKQGLFVSTRSSTRLGLLLALAFVLVACTPDAGSTRQLEGCTVERVFTCTIERSADGRGFSVWLRNTAAVPVLDVSVFVENAPCILETDEAVIERIEPETMEPATFRCTGMVPSTFSGELDIEYTLLSGYAGEPRRPTRGDFVASVR